jgi:hypothetical protein
MDGRTASMTFGSVDIDNIANLTALADFRQLHVNNTGMIAAVVSGNEL